MGSSVRTTFRWGVLAAAGTLLFLAGCTASSDSGSGGGADSASVGRAVAPSAPDPATGDPATDESATGSDGSATGGKASGAAAAPDLPRALIRTADQTVLVDDVPGAARSAQDIARAAGGATAGDTRSGSGSTARAELTLKVAPGQLDATLDRYARLGREVSRTSTTQDVTEDVADIDVRVKSMQASISRVRAILSRATAIGDVVAVEGELSRRTTELESLQARQRALAGQTALATVTLNLVAKDAPYVPPPAERGGFLGGLENGWDAFTTGVGWLLTAAGALLPFLIVLVPLALGVRWWVRRQRTAPAEPVAPPASCSDPAGC